MGDLYDFGLYTLTTLWPVNEESQNKPAGGCVVNASRTQAEVQNIVLSWMWTSWQIILNDRQWFLHYITD